MSRTAVFEVTLSREYSETVTVQYETADGTAKAASGDYVATTGTLTFAPGETTKQILIPIRADDTAREIGTFYVKLKNPTKATLLQEQGTVSIPGDANSYLSRFNYIYNSVHNPENKYFGPQAGASENAVLPLHVAGVDSLIINEAPDYGGETVSETASFWVGLEAWKGFVSGDWAGYNNAWDKIDRYYVPSDANQPVGKYNPASPADYTPEGDLPSDYPRLGQPSAAKGVDPLYEELKNTYGKSQVYLMHWIIDVEGMYGFKNGDGARKNVYINTYERGKQESSFETVTHSCWNDWQNGGSIYGYDPLFGQGKQWYPDAPNDWGKKWSYTNAPDAEARAIQWAFWAKKFATEQGKATDIADSTAKATKMGDYLRYNLFDKYFRQIGNNQVGGTDSNPYSSCHYLINWYAAWGGEIPATGTEASWGYRIGCSESHQGYQGLSTAWALATGGGGMKPASASAGDVWKGSLLRQIEMIRWLQSPEGAIAGGVTNSWNARYETPDDGRNNAKFYGMVYTYSPVWHDPPSNKWAGFQAWGQGRTADLFLEVADKTTTLAVQVRPNLEVILDRLVGWFLKNTSFTADGSFRVPSDLVWHSTTPIAGQTATRPNGEGVYEYLPSLNWDGTGNYSNFWNATSVPNPNLHCSVATFGADLGVASSLSYLLITYAQAKRLLGKFDTTIPNSTYTPRDAYLTAKKLLDRIWTNFQDEHGIGISEPRADYTRYADKVYVPTQFTGAMPNGDPINQASTFISLRSFLKSDSRWPEVQAYINNPVSSAAPVFTYHRFWAQAEYAISCAAMYRYFDDINAANQTA